MQLWMIPFIVAILFGLWVLSWKYPLEPKLTESQKKVPEEYRRRFRLGGFSGDIIVFDGEVIGNFNSYGEVHYFNDTPEKLRQYATLYYEHVFYAHKKREEEERLTEKMRRMRVLNMNRESK